MNIVYNDKTDLLYIRFDDRKQDVINRRISEDIVLDMGENDRIVGIEIMDASRHIFLEKLLPVKYEVQKEKPLQGQPAFFGPSIFILKFHYCRPQVSPKQRKRPTYLNNLSMTPRIVPQG